MCGDQPIQLSDGLIAVIVPKDAKDFMILQMGGNLNFNKVYNYWDLYANGIWNTPFLPLTLKEKHEVLGVCTIDEIDFDCEEFACLRSEIGSQVNFYLDYTIDEYSDKDPMILHSAEQSFRSLLTSKGIELNDNNKVLIIQKT